MRAVDSTPIADEFSVRDLTIQDLELKRLDSGEISVEVALDGVPRRMVLRPHSVRAEGFRVVAGAGDELPEVEAPAALTFRGEIADLAGSAVAASISGQRIDALILSNDGAVWAIQPLPAGPHVNRHAVYSADDVVGGQFRCGVLDDAQPMQSVLGGATDCAGTLHHADIAFDADVEFYALNGSSVPNTVADIEMILNAVGIIYERDLRIRHHLTHITVRTAEPDPYSASDSNSLLDQFTSHWNATQGAVVRDMAHLMTGRDLGFVYGVAFLGVVCEQPSLSYGLSRSRFNPSLVNRVMLTAHEMGHNYNATHCSGPDCGIMCAAFGACSGSLTEFDFNSIAAMAQHRDANTCVAPAAGCSVWTQAAVAGPSGRQQHAMAFDSARNVVVMFGGLAGGEAMGDTWEWNGASWTLRSSGGGGAPAPRIDHAMAFDTVRGVTVLHGGSNAAADTFFSDTWEWNGSNWALRANGGAGPTERCRHALVYDSTRNVSVLFGGFNLIKLLNGDTWEWNGSTWTLRSQTGPQPTFDHAMAYDAGRGVSVLYGGYQEPWLTWEWDGTNWMLVKTNVPGNLTNHAMAYNESQCVTMLLGGLNDGFAVSDAFEWDATYWSHVPGSGPTARSEHAMAFDSVRQQMVMFGGSDGAAETWLLSTGAPVIQSHPADQAAAEGQSASFNVVSTGATPFTYQWRRNGVNLLNGGNISGALSASLVIDPVSASDAASYSVHVSNGCDAVVSQAAFLTVSAACASDLNGNGVVNVSDLLAVIAAWGACPPPCPPCEADLAPPGGNCTVNVQDLLEVIRNWGPCG